MSYGRALAYHAEVDPMRMAITVGDVSVTRAELEASSNRLARALADRGVREADLVTLALPNSVAVYDFTLAVLKLGAIPQPVSSRLPVRELAAIVELADPRLVVGGTSEVAGGRPILPADYSAPTDLDPSQLPDRVSPSWKAPTSGGSTGRPKLIIDATPALLDPTAPNGYGDQIDGVQLVTCPLYHNGPFGYSIRGLLTGNHQVVMHRFDPEETLRLIERHKVDWTMIVPSMMNRIWRLPAETRKSYDLGSLRRIWHMAGPCAPWLKEAWIDWLGPELIWELYGASEQIAATVISGTEWLAHRGSVGQTMFGEIQIRDSDGEIAPPGTVGGIYMRAPGNAVTYTYRGAETDKDADGWQTVGDIGWMDADGYLYLSDRRVDMIVSGGQNIYPAEVEAALDEHPAVLGSAVVGLPDTDLGNVTHAVVQIEPGAEPDVEELRAFVGERLVRYKVPRTLEFVTTPLRDDSGKIRRGAIRQARLDQLAEAAFPARG
nr:AMP-binding protein [Frankia sp. CcI49]